MLVATSAPATAHAQDMPGQSYRATPVAADVGAALAGGGTALTGQAVTAPRRRSIVDTWYDTSAGLALSPDAAGGLARAEAAVPFDRADDGEPGRSQQHASPKEGGHGPDGGSGGSFVVTPSADGTTIALGRTLLPRGNGEPEGRLAVFLDFAQSNGSLVPEDSRITLRLLYSAPFATRPDDAIGFAVTRTHANSRDVSAATIANALGNPVSPTQRPEYSSELYYRFALAPGLALRPGLEFISDPGGTPANRSTLVAGFKLVASF